MVEVKTLDKTLRSHFAIPHVQLTRFFRFKYTGFDMGCHAEHLIAENRAISSLMTFVP